MRYSPNWRVTALVAIFLHFFVCLGAGFALPLLDFKGDPVTIDEMTMVEDYGEEKGTEEAEPEKPAEEPPPLPPAVEIPSEEAAPLEAKTTEEAIAKLEEDGEQEESDAKGDKPQKQQNMQQFGALIVEGYTPDTSGTTFRGRVGIRVDLDENGQMTDYDITKPSKRVVVDNICVNAVRRFKFEPAVDMEGRRMKTKRLIMFVFDGSGPHVFDDDENKRIRVSKELWMREHGGADKASQEKAEGNT